MDSIFYQIGLILGIAAFFGIVAQKLKQPLIVAFIAVGILMGPAGLGMVDKSSEIELFARLGIAILLFVVGLKLDIHIIRTVGPVALASGLGQVFFTSVFGFLIALALGFDSVSSIYIAVALTFSSTIIIVKLLSDKRELDSLHGRIAVGFLIVQDIVVVLVMIALTASSSGSGDTSMVAHTLSILFKGACMLIGVALLMKYVLPSLLQRLAHSSELLMLFSVAWAVLGAILGDALGFSKEVGAFLAGISIASTPYREQIAARLVSLRDFLLLFFFIELGASLELASLGHQIIPALVLSLFVLIGNPIIVMAIMGYMGYRKRTGFLAGLTVAQISEFSLILAALGYSLGHLHRDIVGLVTLVGIITISISTYMILYSHQIHEKLSRFLAIFERKGILNKMESDISNEAMVDVLTIGLGRFGSAIAGKLQEKDCHVLALDFDPSVISSHEQKGYAIHYGDAEDPEFIGTLPLSRIRWVVSTIRDKNINDVLIKNLRSAGYKGKIALSISSNQEAVHYQENGVDLTLLPYSDAAQQTVNKLMPDIQKG